MANSAGPMTLPTPNHAPVEVENHKAHLENRRELVRSVVMAGDSALKMMLLINGGAAVAVLAFLGKVLSKAPIGLNLSVTNIKAGLVRFMLGVAFVGVGALSRFVAIYAAMSGSPRIEVACSYAALLAGMGSLSAFVLGGMWVVGAVW